jgi:hypothetical protein
LPAALRRWKNADHPARREISLAAADLLNDRLLMEGSTLVFRNYYAAVKAP